MARAIGEARRNSRLAMPRTVGGGQKNQNNGLSADTDADACSFIITFLACAQRYYTRVNSINLYFFILIDCLVVKLFQQAAQSNRNLPQIFLGLSKC